MRTAVVYYSHTGNTHRIAQIIIGVLKSKNEEAIPVRIRPLKEETNFLKQCRDSFLSKKPELYRTLLNLKDYDRINFEFKGKEGFEEMPYLSLRMTARIQGFPDNHCQAASTYDQYPLYGNAVPPAMVKWVIERTINNKYVLILRRRPAER